MDYTCLTKTEIIDWLKNNLNEERYIHSLATADTAKSFAEKFGVDEEKAYIAGLLHDCAKCFSNDKLRDFIEQGVEITEDEKPNYKTYHAPVSAYIAKTVFKVTDEEILSSIRWHTVGKLNMTTFEKIIFLADKAEPKTRPSDYREFILCDFDKENGLDRCILACYKATIKSLADRNLTICTPTIEVYNELLNELS